ncbi:MAG TPA: diguanylate cyclase, partial [Candidatus Dormibacteraeota bacterium]
MPPIQRSTRVWFAVGSALVIAAAILAVVAARLPSSVLHQELGLFGIGTVYAIATVICIRRLLSYHELGSAITTAVNISLATAILAVAAPYLPEAMPLSFAVLVSVVLAAILTRGPSWSLPLCATAAGVAGLSVVFTRLEPPADLREFLVWAGLLAGVGMLVEVHRRIGRAETDQQLRNLAITASAAHALAASTDLSSIARAVLEAFQAAFPHLNWGGILLLREGKLQPLPLALTPNGVTATPVVVSPPVEIRPGDGLAGKAYVTGEVQTRSTVRQMQEAATPGGRLKTFIDKNIGTVRSAMAVPLRIPGAQSTGVISLGSTAKEHSWSDGDVVLARGLADVAAVAIQRGELSDEQRKQASTDHLTALPNRREFERILNHRSSSRARYSMLVADVDNLKMINDEYGHEAGDGVLRIVARVLRSGLRARDTVARIGGDEFAAYMPSTDMATAASIAERILDATRGVASPFGAARLSIGVADGDEATPHREVWDRADAALYNAKQTGRNRVRASVHRGTPGSPAVRWSEVVGELVDDRAITSVYQPIVRFADRNVVGYEALARRPGHAEEHVDGMFAAAQRLGFSRDLDWIARRAALDGARSLPHGSLLFINVGVLALVDPLHDIDQMFLLLNWAGRRPDEVVLELSEREAVTDRARLRAVLSSYRYHGFRFAIDDVGEGHSTIEVLATARPEFIKVAGTLSRGP